MKNLIITTALALAMIGPARADCEALKARLDPSDMYETVGRAMHIVQILQGNAPLSAKLDALESARPLLDRTVARGYDLLSVMQAAKAEGCLRPGAEGISEQSQRTIQELIDRAKSSRIVVDAGLAKYGR